MIVYLSVAGGVVISVLLPVLRALLPKPPISMSGTKRQRIGPYLYTGLFSLVAAVVIVAAFGDQLDSWRTALIAGYTWDSTIQKMITGNAPPRDLSRQPASS